jgi:hypothetical protein
MEFAGIIRAQQWSTPIDLRQAIFSRMTSGEPTRLATPLMAVNLWEALRITDEKGLQE